MRLILDAAEAGQHAFISPGTEVPPPPNSIGGSRMAANHPVN